MVHERRRAPRCAVIASAEVIELQTNTRLKARISDLSLVGCYLDIANTLPVGTEMRLNIAHNDATFSALGIVTHCEPGLGMGVRFADVPLDQNAILDKWLLELVRE